MLLNLHVPVICYIVYNVQERNQGATFANHDQFRLFKIRNNKVKLNKMKHMKTIKLNRNIPLFRTSWPGGQSIRFSIDALIVKLICHFSSSESTFKFANLAFMSVHCVHKMDTNLMKIFSKQDRTSSCTLQKFMNHNFQRSQITGLSSQSLQ